MILKGETRLFGSLMMIFKSFLVYKPLKYHSGFYSVYLKECRIFIHSCLSHKRMSGDHEVEMLCLLHSKRHQKTPPSSLGNVLCRHKAMRNIHTSALNATPLFFS